MPRLRSLFIVLVMLLTGAAMTTVGFAQTNETDGSMLVDEAVLEAFADALATLQGSPLDAAQQAALVALSQQVTMAMDDALGPVVTYTFDQDEANEILDGLIGLAGYTAEQTSADLQPGGVLVTVTDAYEGETLQFWLTGGMEDGGMLDLNIAWTILDGERFSMPGYNIAELIMEIVVTDVVEDVFDGLFAALDGFGYVPWQIYVTEDEIVVTALVAISVPLADA